jgi:hypothetical protein
MKNVIFEIDGEKHRLVEDNEDEVCAKCSLQGIACESSCLCIISGCGKCHYEKIIE